MSDHTRTRALVEQARERYRAWCTAEQELRESASNPVLVAVKMTDEDGEGFTRITCPGCGRTDDWRGENIYDTDLVVVDASERWTRPHRLTVDGDLRVTYDGTEDYNGVCYLMICCHTPVDLPDDWTEKAVW